MKKFLLIVCSAFLMAASVEAQITVTKYPNVQSIRATEVIDSEIKYSNLAKDGSKLTIYNSDHSVYKVITIPSKWQESVGSGIEYKVTQNLFDLDEGLEVLFFGELRKNGGYVGEFTLILDEDGTELLNLESWLPTNWDYNEAILVNESETMMLLEGPSDSVAVYSLPGQLEKITAVENPAGAESLQAYPNPASDIVQVAYAIPEGQTQGQLKIYNEQGILVKSFEVDKTFDHLLLNVSDFEQGVYTYRLEGNGFATNTEKLVVMR